MQDDSFVGLVRRVLEFVSRMAVETYSDRQSQRLAPTFVLIAGSFLHNILVRGGLHTKNDLGMGDLATFIGNLHIGCMAAELLGNVPIDEVAAEVRGIGYSYHFTDDDIADWEQFILRCNDDEPPIDAILARLERISEPIARVAGPNSMVRADTWAMLIADINREYVAMLERPEWIEELDPALERAMPKRADS